MDVGQANLVSSKTSRIQVQMPSKAAITVKSFNSCTDQSHNKQMILSTNFKICFGPKHGSVQSVDVTDALKSFRRSRFSKADEDKTISKLPSDLSL